MSPLLEARLCAWRHEMASFLMKQPCVKLPGLVSCAGHMAREEADVLPLLEARLCAGQQRDMVWRTLQAMPLRLLERVLPWLAGA